MTDKELAETIEKADELTLLKLATTAIITLAQNSTLILIILGIIMCCQITQCK